MSKRSLFQFRLSTLLMISLLLGCGFWLNLGNPGYRSGGPNGSYEIYGWPLTFERYVHYDEDGVVNGTEWVNEDNELVYTVLVDTEVLLVHIALVLLLHKFLYQLRRPVHLVESLDNRA